MFPWVSPLWRFPVVAAILSVAAAGHASDLLPSVDARALAPVVDGGLTPEQVAIAARATAPNVALADNALRAAEAQVALARVAAVPRVDLGAGYTRLSTIEQPPFSFGGQSITSPFPVILDQYSLSASLSVPLSDIFLRALPGLDIVRRSADARELEARAQAIVAEWQGREAYHGWLRALTARNVAAASVATLRATLDNVEALADAGVLPRLDVISTRAGVEQAQTALRQAEHGVTLAEDAIRILTGWEDGSAFEPGEDLLVTPDIPAPTAEELVERALVARPEVALFAELLSISSSRVRIQRTGGWPSLHVGAGVLYANPNPRIVPSEEQFDATWDVGISIAWSPNDLWRARAQVDQASIERDRVREELRAFELGLRNEAARAANAWARALTAIDGARDQLEAATEEFEARAAALDGGVGTTTELLAAQGRLVSAWMDLLDGAVELRRSMSLAARITGEDTALYATSGTPVAPLWPRATTGQP